MTEGFTSRYEAWLKEGIEVCGSKQQLNLVLSKFKEIKELFSWVENGQYQSLLAKELEEEKIMDLETEERLNKIKEIEERIQASQEEITLIKSNCRCLDHKAELIETFAFEHTPRHVCVLCGSYKDDTVSEVSEAEQKILWEEFFSDCAGEEELVKKAIKDGGYTFD